MPRAKISSKRKLNQIKKIFEGPKNRRSKSGINMTYDIYYNLMGPVIEYGENKTFDHVSYLTLKMVLGKLGKIKRILNDP